MKVERTLALVLIFLVVVPTVVVVLFGKVALIGYIDILLAIAAIKMFRLAKKHDPLREKRPERKLLDQPKD